MTNDTLERAPGAPTAQIRQIKGFSPDSVTVFALGLFGFTIPLFGVVPSVMAVAKSKGARKQLLRARGNFRGKGLVKAGVIFAWLGILNTMLVLALTAFATWAAVNVPSLLPSLMGSAASEGTLDPTAMLSLLDSQDLKSLLSDPAVVKSLEGRLLEAGVDPATLFSGSGSIADPKP